MICSSSPTTVQADVSMQPNAALAGHKLILHKDGYHQQAYVVLALIRVVSLGVEESRAIVAAAWARGTAIVITCPLEVAEHYQAQLLRQGLTVTVE